MKLKNKNPIQLFSEWFEDAKIKEIESPEAMTLATCNKEMIPSIRVVLLKFYDERGFVFFTNLTSQKAKELSINPFASLCFYWKSLKKQVRIKGKVELVSDEEADFYFQTRPRLSQIGAWASKQSQELSNRFELEKNVAKYMIKFKLKKIPRPEFWSGFRLKPESMEFWIEKPYRLHNRYIFYLQEDKWKFKRLFP